MCDSYKSMTRLNMIFSQKGQKKKSVISLHVSGDHLICSYFSFNQIGLFISISLVLLHVVGQHILD